MGGARTWILCVSVCVCVCGYDADTGHQSVPGLRRRRQAKDGQKEEEMHCVTNKTYSSGLRGEEVEKRRTRRKKGKQILSSILKCQLRYFGIILLSKQLENQLTILFKDALLDIFICAEMKK